MKQIYQFLIESINRKRFKDIERVFKWRCENLINNKENNIKTIEDLDKLIQKTWNWFVEIHHLSREEETKIITFKKDPSDSLIGKWAREVFNKN